MPGSSVSITDYLAIEIACRHTAIQRSVIAKYFNITVNALNARLRTCGDRLQPFPDFVAYGTNLLAVVMKIRPDFEGKVHPIWEMSRKLLQSFTDGTLAVDLQGFKESQGTMFDFLTRAEFMIDGQVPEERPQDDMPQLPSGRKRKHGVESTRSASRPASPAFDGPSLPRMTAITISGTDRPATAKKVKQNTDVQKDDLTADQADDTDTVVPEKLGGKGSRSEPYSQHELCTVYIARRIRALDWDLISWSLSRFKTPTVAILSEARAAFDQYHDLILETLKLCCWPEDSMYLIACAASECIGALDRGQWAEELKNFRASRGLLYEIHMQRRIQRLYKKSFETPEEKKFRRRRERILGYEWLSSEEYARLPPKKRAGAQQTNASREPYKVRRRRTKEEMQQEAEEKAAARALLKANGLKANGDAIAKKPVDSIPSDTASPETEMPPTFKEMETKETKEKVSKLKKDPRRKYDIPELERIAFAGDIPKDRRLSYDVRPEDQISRKRLKAEASRVYGSYMSLEPLLGHFSPAHPHRGRSSEDRTASRLDRLDKTAIDAIANLNNEVPSVDSNSRYKALYVTENPRPSASKTRLRETSPIMANSQFRPPSQHMAITNLVQSPPLGHHRNHNISAHQAPGVTGSFEQAAASPLAGMPPHFGSRAADEPSHGRSAEKPRSSMSLSALLN